MCGIGGYLWHGTPEHDPAAILKRMGDAIVHRGPDDGDCWLDLESEIGFVHRRLSVLELSEAGAQPMLSPSGRYVIVFNGEIYNHLEIRAELAKCSIAIDWRGHSDTETLLAAIDAWGLEAAVMRAIGMFAMAIWDRAERTLHLVRDRIGEKPLYYGWLGTGERRSFAFGSELKALRSHPDFRQPIDRDALALFLRHNCIPAPRTIYQQISKLLPGQILSLRAGQCDPTLTTYWSGAEVIKASRQNPFEGSENAAVDELEVLLKDAVRQQMLSDVPLGAFLSGGVDSSLIAALMQTQSGNRVKTFTIGFDDPAFNEAQHAKSVAEHLGTDHTELYVTSRDALDLVPRLPELYDEPFADSSQIPTFLVARLARTQVTVALSGDGGDELFGGYNRYDMTSRLWAGLKGVPIAARRALSHALVLPSPRAWDAMANSLGFLAPSLLRQANFGDRLHKGAGVLPSKSATELYRHLVSHWQQPADIVLGATEPSTLVSHPPQALEQCSNIERMMALDLLTYLPDDILVKVDRAAMGVSLETRVPLLDHRVVEFAWRLPLTMKLREGQTKWALRQVLYRHVPRALIERPKVGFGVPLASWLRSELRDWAEALLDERRLQQEGYFDAMAVRTKWDEHLSGRRNWSYQLWDVLMFQAWLEKF